MKVIGLTGQSGAGKTTVGKIFADAGFAVINADKIAREVMRKGESCLAETIAAFGEEYLLPDGELDRKRLAETVFSDRKKLDLLESITYPHINKKVNLLIEKFRAEGFGYVLLDAPTLFEAGEDKICDEIIAVISDEKTRIERIIYRDGISVKQASDRFANQHDIEFFKTHADYIIENSGTRSALEERTKAIIGTITERLRNE